ncbi:MAG: FxSxx-COOH system tetratricopeptide repeat protein, partial [Actinoplanes sp.]
PAHRCAEVGKTQLAVEYAHRHMDEFDLVWWISAEDPAEVRRSMVELADVLQVAVAGDASTTIGRVLAALSRPTRFRRWLLIFDDIGDPESVWGLLPSPASGQILLTSREAGWALLETPIEVGGLARAESVELLQRAGGLTAAAADAVAESLLDLPVSLVQAAAWFAGTVRPQTAYVSRLEEAIVDLADDDEPGYPPPLAATIRVSLDELVASSDEAALLLQLASGFNAGWIALDLLYRGRFASHLTRRLGRTLRDHAPLHRAIKEMARWGLVRDDSRNARFQVHASVRHLIRKRTSAQLSRDVGDTVRLMLAYANPGNPDHIPSGQAAKHAEMSAHITAADLLEADDPDARRVVLDQIRFRYLSGDYESSLDTADKALAVWPPADEFVLIARRHRASALAALGRPAEALEIGQDVHRQLERSLGADHEHTMTTVNGIGRDLRTLGRFAEAYALSRENFERHVRILGPDDRATLRAANDYAADLRLSGEFAAALQRDRRTAAEAQAVYGSQDPWYQLSLSNVARDLYALGRYRDAFSLQSGSLPAYEAVLGAGHPEVLMARRTMVMCLRKMGMIREAVAEGEALLLAFRNRLGDRHPNTLLVMQTLMNALRSDNDLDRAMEIGEEALAAYEADLPEHPFRPVCMTNLAIVYRIKSFYLVKGARQMNERALDSLTRLFGAAHPYTLCCATNLANDVAADREYDKASAMSADVLLRSRQARGEHQPYTLACAVNHALDLMKVQDPSGVDAYASAITSMNQSPELGPDHPDMAMAALGRRLDCDIEAPPA